MPVQSTIPILGAPNYQGWFSMLDNGSDQEKNRTFERDIIPYISDYAEGTSFNAVLEEHQWLREFIDPESSYAATLREFEHRPNEATITMADFVKHLAGTVITVAWQENMKTFVQNAEANPSGGRLMNDGEVTECREAFEKALPKLADHPLWRVLCARVRAFSLRIGCPTAAAEPLDCITCMRIHMNARVSRIGEATSRNQRRPLVKQNWGACLSTLEGHGDGVRSVVFSHDSKLVASASSDKTVRIWSVETGECEQVLEGHNDCISSVVFSHDSKLVASASDRMVRIWSVETGECQQVLEGYGGGVRSVVFSHDSKLVASTSNDKTVRIWSVETGKCEKVLEGHSRSVLSVVFSYDSKLIASASLDKTVRIWMVETGKCEKVLEDHSDWVNSVVFSHNSKLIASAALDKTVRIWIVETGKCEKVLEGHSSSVISVVFSYDSKLMASASNDKTVRIWSVETGKCEQVLDGHIDCITSVVFSHDSKLVASASHKMVWIWSVETGECQQILEGHSSWVISAVFSHDSKLIASGSVDKTVRIWRMEAGKCEQVLEGHRDSVNLGYTALHAVAGGGHSESETRSNDDHGNHEDDELDYQDWEDEVNVSHPVVMTGLPSTLPELVDTIFHTISPISEPAVPLGKTRIRWQCRCGENLFDDFVEVKPGSLMALQARLREMNGTHDSNQERDNSAQQQVLILRRSLSSVGAWIRHGVMRIVAIGDQGANSLPLHSLSPQSQQDSLQNQEVLHLLLCIDKGESLTRLYQERLQGVSGDGELFLFLRYQYYKHRNFASWFTLRCVRNLSLSRVHPSATFTQSIVLLILPKFKVDANCFASVHSHGYACTSQCVCLPPVEMVDENEYRCAPAPRVQPDYFPAIGSRELTHYFLKPHTFDIPQRILYNQIPKRACGQLRASQDEAQLGWGLHLQEGWHWRTIYFVVVVLLVTGSFVFGVTWSLLKRDIQGAFAIAGTWLALGPLLLGYIAVRDI